MKKYFYGLILLVLCAGLIFSVYGCGGSNGAGGPLDGINGPIDTQTGAAVATIVDNDGDNKSSDNNEEEVTFFVKGQNFGLQQGEVRFTNVKDNTVYNGEVLVWADSQIIGNVTIPAGKYLVQVIADGVMTTDQVFYLKGTGSFPVTAQ